MGGPATLLGRLGKPRGVDAGVGNRKKQIRTVTGPLHSPGPGGGALSWNISHHHKEHGSAQRSVDFQPNLAFRCPKHAPCLSLLGRTPTLSPLGREEGVISVRCVCQVTHDWRLTSDVPYGQASLVS